MKEDRFKQLIEKLDLLFIAQRNLSEELDKVKQEVNLLHIHLGEEVEKADTDVVDLSSEDEASEAEIRPNSETVIRQESIAPDMQEWNTSAYKGREKSGLEKFIGENLISKLGIVITVIGVGIGVKYSIDNDLMSPLVRVLLGYFFGFGLLGVAVLLKKRYTNYSSVLASGAMAMNYFITYAAYDMYGLLGQGITFVIMVMLTAGTVFAALKYDRQVIAHFGMVGAYAVPFLLSDGTGNVAVLFTYMAIINAGILALSFFKYWKPLYFSSAAFTWLIFTVWSLANYKPDQHLFLASWFLFLYFITFYLTFLAYKLLKSGSFDAGDILLLLFNSFVFYGLGFLFLSSHENGKHLLGAFTLGNALLHFFASALIYLRKHSDRNLLFLVFGLSLVFATLFIPVQLEGNWVPLLWSGEAALLFWIGRSRKVSFFEYISLPLMIMAFAMLAGEWIEIPGIYDFDRGSLYPALFFNVNFVTALLFVSAFGFMSYINGWNSSPSVQPVSSERTLISGSINSILLLSLYFTFRTEIATLWNKAYANSFIESDLYPEYSVGANFWNRDFKSFKTITLLAYTFLFLSGLAYLNLKRFKNYTLGIINSVLIIICSGVFLLQGLGSLSELRDSYINQNINPYHESSVVNLWVRYIVFSFVGLALIMFYRYSRETNFRKPLAGLFDFTVHVLLVWVLSNELMHWMSLFGYSKSDKLMISIVWGVYALFLIILGIRSRKAYLRIGAMIWFGITLLKLFFYDISHLSTPAKTVVFVSLGVLLLVISFLYTRYRNQINAD